MAKTITFEKLANGNVIISIDDKKHRFDVNARVTLFSKDIVNIYDRQKTVPVDWRQVEGLSVTSGEELFNELVLNFFFNDLNIRVNNLEDYELIAELTKNIQLHTTGQIDTPQNSTFERGAYPDGQAGIADEDCLVAFTGLDDQASGNPAKTAGGAFIFVATLDGSLNYTLTGLPSANASLYYAVRIKLKYWQNIDTWAALSPDNNVANRRLLTPDDSDLDKHFTYTQAAPAAVWTVTHNLNKFPSVTVVDSANTEVVGEVRHISTTQAEITFSGAFAGKAFFN